MVAIVLTVLSLSSSMAVLCFSLHLHFDHPTLPHLAILSLILTYSRSFHYPLSSVPPYRHGRFFKHRRCQTTGKLVPDPLSLPVDEGWLLLDAECEEAGEEGEGEGDEGQGESNEQHSLAGSLR